MARGSQIARPLDRGVQNRLGKYGPHGSLLRAKNCRYLPTDPIRLHAILGRSRYSENEFPAQTVPTGDANSFKRLAVLNFDGDPGALCVHRGGSLFEGALAASGTFTEAAALAGSPGDSVPAGTFVPYGNRWHYWCGNSGGAAWSATRQAWVRYQGQAWRRAGHRQPTDAFTVTPASTLVSSGPVGEETWEEFLAANSIVSRYRVKYLFRLYDANFDLFSQHSSVVVEIPGEEDGEYSVGPITITWPAGVTKPADLGTHVQLYRTNLNEPAGIYFRIDGNDDGIPLADVTAGYTVIDAVDNATAILNGTVRADGLEGTLDWAEHGGAPPPGNGAVMFRNQMVVWDVPGEEDKIIASAQGYPESFPVDFEGRYVYAFPFQTKRADRVLFCVAAGQFLLVFLRFGIFRVAAFPSKNDRDSNSNPYEPVTDEHGAVGPRAGCAFGIGRDQAQKVVYLSREHNLMLTDGIKCVKAVPDFDLTALVEPSRLSEVEFVDYPKYEEVRVAYTPVGGTSNTETLILDYSMQGGRRGEMRVTWPVPLRSASMGYGVCDDAVARLFIADPRGFVYVEDNGGTDEQQNHNAAGEFEFDIQTGRLAVLGQTRSLTLVRAFLHGASGIARRWLLKTFFVDGATEYDTQDYLTIGPGEMADSAWVNAYGQGFREQLVHVGLSGDSYEPGAANEALCFSHLEYETGSGGRATRSREQ